MNPILLWAFCQVPTCKVMSIQWVPCAKEREGAEANSFSPRCCEEWACVPRYSSSRGICCWATNAEICSKLLHEPSTMSGPAWAPETTSFQSYLSRCPSLSNSSSSDFLNLHPQFVQNLDTYSSSLPVNSLPHFQSWMLLLQGVPEIVGSSLWWFITCSCYFPKHSEPSSHSYSSHYCPCASLSASI